MDAEKTFKKIFKSQQEDFELPFYLRDIKYPKNLDLYYKCSYRSKIYYYSSTTIYLFKLKRPVKNGGYCSLSEIYQTLKINNQGLKANAFVKFFYDFYSWVSFTEIIKYFREFDNREQVKIIKKGDFLLFQIDSEFYIAISPEDFYTFREQSENNVNINWDCPEIRITQLFNKDIDDSKTFEVEIDYTLIPKAMEIIEQDLWDPPSIHYDKLNRIDLCKNFLYDFQKSLRQFHAFHFFQLINQNLYKRNTRTKSLLQETLFFSLIDINFNSQIYEALQQKGESYSEKVDYITYLNNWPISYLKSYCKNSGINIKKISKRGNFERTIFEFLDGKLPKSREIELTLFTNNIETALPEIKKEIDTYKKTKNIDIFYKIQEYIFKNHLEYFCLHNNNIYFLRDNTLDLTAIGIKSISELDSMFKFKTRIYTLYLGYNEIRSLKGIEKLTKLEELHLPHNLISEIEGFENLKNLDVLDLSHNKINDLNGLKNLYKLEELKLAGNNIPEEKLIEIGGLDNEGFVKDIKKILDFSEKFTPLKETGRVSTFEYLKNWPIERLQDYCFDEGIELDEWGTIDDIVNEIVKSNPKEKPRLKITKRLLSNFLEFKKVISHFSLENNLRNLLFNLRPITELKDLSELSNEEIITTIFGDAKYEGKRETIYDFLDVNLGKHYDEVMKILILAPSDLHKPDISLQDIFTFEGKYNKINVTEQKLQGNYKKLKINIERDLLEEDLKNIGRWGEKVIYDHVLKKYSQNQRIKIFWMNELREVYEPYDILIIENKQPKFIEVKSTITNTTNFNISGKELNLAKKYGKYYILYFVKNAGKPNASFYQIKDFYEKFLKNFFKVNSLSLKF